VTCYACTSFFSPKISFFIQKPDVPLSNQVSPLENMSQFCVNNVIIFQAIFENYVAEIRLDGKAVQLALWDTA
jgi:hypothetical protein